MEQIGLQPKAGLARTAAADDQDIFVPRRFRVFGAAVHRQPLRLRENDVVLKCGIDVGLDVLGGSPTGAAVLQIFAEFLCVFALDIDRQPNGDGGGNAHAQVNGMKAGDKGVERRVQAGHNVQQLRGSVRTGSQPHRLADLGGQQRDEHIRNIGKDELFDVDLLHRSSSFRFVLSTTAA